MAVSFGPGVEVGWGLGVNSGTEVFTGSVVGLSVGDCSVVGEGGGAVGRAGVEVASVRGNSVAVDDGSMAAAFVGIAVLARGDWIIDVGVPALEMTAVDVAMSVGADCFVGERGVLVTALVGRAVADRAATLVELGSAPVFALREAA